jgi:hypothetical protein
MRSSNLRGVGLGRAPLRGFAVALVVAALLAACSASAAPTGAPTAGPTSVPSADPHLSDPASVDSIYRALAAAGFDLVANTASSSPGREPVKRISATYGKWPLILSEFSSAAALQKATAFDPAKALRAGEPPFVLAGLNILVEYGPKSTNAAPKRPAAPRSADAQALVFILDPLLGPLRQRSVVALILPGSAAPSAAPLRSAGATPRP